MLSSGLNYKAYFMKHGMFLFPNFVKNFFQPMSRFIFQPMFIFEKHQMLFLYTGSAARARRYACRRSRSDPGLWILHKRPVAPEPHRLRASVIPIVCLRRNGGWDVSPETYRISEFETISKTFSRRCQNIFLATSFFSKTSDVNYSYRFSAGRRPDPPSKIFDRSRLAALAPIHDTRAPFPIVYAMAMRASAASELRRRRPPFLHTLQTYRMFFISKLLPKLFSSRCPKTFSAPSFFFENIRCWNSYRLPATSHQPPRFNSRNQSL